MPGYDGTGPRGQGPRTGGGFGWCPPGAGPASAPPPGGVAYGVGRGGRPWGGGRARCFGGGRGRWSRQWAYAPAPLAPPPGVHPGAPTGLTPEPEVSVLQEQAEVLRQQLAAIQARLDELQRSSNEE